MTYTVVFEASDNSITAIYDQTGTIVSCKESYNNVRMPSDVSIRLAKKYPGWEFNEIEYTIDYQKDKNTVLAYEVRLKKGKLSKTVKLTP